MLESASASTSDWLYNAKFRPLSSGVLSPAPRADTATVGPVVRHPLPVAIVAVAVAATAGLFVFARPQYRSPQQGTNIEVPDKRPAADAAGRAGWTWPDGVPGWEPGYTVGGYNLSQVQPIETQPAALAAAHSQLDASRLRVVVAQHIVPGDGPLAILAAPVADATPTTACLAVALPASNDVEWRCPGASSPYPDLARSRVLLGVMTRPWAGRPSDARELALVGVARGDVRRIVLHLAGDPNMPLNDDLYDRGKTWGQFEANLLLRSPSETPELRIYGDHGLVQTIRLRLAADEQRVIG